MEPIDAAGPIIVNKPSFFKRHKKAVIIWAIVAVIVLGAGGATAYGLYWYNSNLKPLSSDQAHIRVAITEGMTAGQIGNLLQEKKVIRSGKVFNKYVTKAGLRDKLQAGTYLLSPSQSVQDIAAMIAEGRIDSFMLTITPGQTLKNIRANLIKAGFDEQQLDAALAKKYDHPLFAGKPAGQDLEGYIYPETYQVTSQTTPEEFLRHTFDIFYQDIQKDGILGKLSGQNMTLYQAITLASIIQKESSKPDEQKKISQVFHSRLAQDISLGSDVTFIYASEKAGVAEDVNIDSPYNTRIYKGLPPGPISNFTMSSLIAAVSPATTDWLFFVAGDDGTIYYSKTQEEHEALTEKYCTKLCQ